MKAQPLVNNFNTGEVSDLIESRSDLAKYAAACKTLENAFALVEGGAKKMPGTYFAGIAANGGPLGTATTGKSRLVQFQFSENQNAILEFFAGGIRFWIDNGLVTSVGGLVDWVATTNYAVGAQVLLGGYSQIPCTGGSILFVQSPYGQGNLSSVYINVGTNTVDSLSVTKFGVSPMQGIQILLANATSGNNAAAAIQAAIQALGYLNSPISNYIDVSAWTTAWLPTGAAPAIAASSLNNKMTVLNNGWQSTSTPNTGAIPGRSPIFWKLITVGNTPLVVTTPYAEADLFDLDVSTQSADVLYIVHTTYPPATLNRYSDTNWTYTPIAGATQTPSPGPGQLYGTSDVVRTGYSALGQSISNITLANPAVVTFASPTQPFFQGDRIYLNECTGLVELNQGQFIAINPGGSPGAYTYNLKDPDTGAVIDTSAFPMALTYEGGGFAVAIPSQFCGPGNYPACAALYQQRLCLAGSLLSPMQMNGSTQGDYPDFICDPNDDSYAIQFTLVAQQVNQLRWMIGSPNALLLGTAGGVWAMYTVDGQPLSQVDVTAALQNTVGTGNVAPQLVNSDVIWTTRSGMVVRLFLFNFATNQWDGPDLTRLNRQITIGPTQATSGIVQTAFQKELYPIFWAVRADGQLIGMTYERQEEVFAWFRVVTDGIIESVAVVSQDGAEDQVWISVQRTVDGVAQRYIEFFMPQEIYGQLSNAFFVHAGLQWNGGTPAAIMGISQANPTAVNAPGHGLATGDSAQITGVVGMTQINQGPASAYTVTVIDANNFTLDGMDSTGFPAYVSGGIVAQVTNQVSGMDHLTAKTVVAVGDGAIIFQGPVPVGGVVNFGSYANLVTIGLPFTTTIEPMNPIVGAPQATSKGKKQKISRATFSLYQSIGGKYATAGGQLFDMAYGTGAMGLQPTMSTTVITRDLDGDWADEDALTIVHDLPFPFTIRSIVPRLDVADNG